MCTNSVFWKNVCRCISNSGNFVLGIGTIILGLTALCKVKDITDAVNNVQDLNSTVISMRKLEHDNQDILNKIKDINDKNTTILNMVRSKVEELATQWASQYTKDENRAELNEFLQKITVSNGIGAVAQLQAFGSVSRENESSELKKNSIDKVVNKWMSFKTKEDKIK